VLGAKLVRLPRGLFPVNHSCGPGIFVLLLTPFNKRWKPNLSSYVHMRLMTLPGVPVKSLLSLHPVH
jgi:hypothetical protein